MVLFTPVVVYLAVRLGFHLLNSTFQHAETSLTKRRATRVPVVSTKLANLLAIVIALAAMVGLAMDSWAPRRSTTAWKLGSEGEATLGRSLDRLTERGYRVFHDLAIPGSRANIDHLVVGPTGVYVIDAKNYSGRVTFSKGTLWHGRYPLTKTISTVRWEADQVVKHLPPETAVSAVMCVMGVPMPRDSMQVGGVHVVEGPRRLAKGVLARPAVLSQEAVDRLTSEVSARFPA